MRKITEKQAISPAHLMRISLAELTKIDFITIRDEMESNWKESMRDAMQVLSLSCINRFGVTLSELKLNEIMTRQDLFETYHELPKEVKKVIDSYNEDGDLYQEASRLEFKLLKLGYEMEYGLDGIPYHLRKKV